MEEVQLGVPAGAVQALDVRFTGSGGEYFRIWIVNLLLTIVTLGLYYPWAKARRLRYFCASTLVGGHALDFHGDPKSMLRGYLLAGALLAMYSLSGKISLPAGIVALLAVAGAYPALVWVALRFRLANTSWRGLRLRFAGTIGGAYRALLPAVVPVVLFISLGALVRQRTEVPGHLLHPGLALGVLLSMLSIPALAPLVLWLFKRYQHGHLALGEECGRLTAGPGPFYLLAVKIALVFALTLLLLMAGPIILAGGPAGYRNRLLVLLLLAFAYLVVLVIVGAYAVARLQNLLWSNTASARIRFGSALRALPYIRLAVTNLVLVIVTLGLYWPFAATALARMRLEAMAIQLDVPADELSAEPRRDDDATGDAAGDLFGLDIGF
ncbi:MAG: hypothetical protein NAOJABEB_02816 [Steroidobacteraceae bacterium]|nr:hypothetical protein [Steroidobacteraceae bacterium]